MKAKKKIRIGWKVVLVGPGGRQALLKLQILGKVVTPYGRAVADSASGFRYLTKRRTDGVKVLAAYRVIEVQTGWQEGRQKKGRKYVRAPKLYSRHDPTFVYKVGVTEFTAVDEDRSRGCSYGLHFFDTEQDALLWAEQ